MNQGIPISVVLHCPHCKKQHVEVGKWAFTPHRTHACVDDRMGLGCGKPFTPSAQRTYGVQQEDLKFEMIDEPLLGMKPDMRSQRWRDAEAACGPGHCPPWALAVIAEEQAKWDEENGNR